MRIDNGKLLAMTQARAYQRLEPMQKSWLSAKTFMLGAK